MAGMFVARILMRALVGDIGGTKTNLALAEIDPASGEIRLLEPRRYASAAFSSLEACAAAYLDERGELERGSQGVFALAGPVADGRCATTNLPWIVDARELAAALGLQRVVLINDLEAVAWSVSALDPSLLVELHAGAGMAGNACVIAAGTGLGEAGMFWDGTRHHPFASEGGHADFAPVTELERELLSFLARSHGRVSWERVVSGMGIPHIHAFVLERRGLARSAALQAVLDEGGDLAAAIADAAARGDDDGCVETMDLLFGLLGREAANLALKHMALGGVYLGGGVVTRNLELLRRGPLLERFFDKGRMSELVRRMPVRVIVDDHAGLLGAACRAARF